MPRLLISAMGESIFVGGGMIIIFSHSFPHIAKKYILDAYGVYSVSLSSNKA